MKTINLLSPPGSLFSRCPRLPSIKPSVWVVMVMLMVLSAPVFAQSGGGVWSKIGGGFMDQYCEFMQSPIVVVSFLIAILIIGLLFIFGQSQGFMAKLMGFIFIAVFIFAAPIFLTYLPYIGEAIESNMCSYL